MIKNILHTKHMSYVREGIIYGELKELHNMSMSTLNNMFQLSVKLAKNPSIVCERALIKAGEFYYVLIIGSLW